MEQQWELLSHQRPAAMRVQRHGHGPLIDPAVAGNIDLNQGRGSAARARNQSAFRCPPTGMES